MIHLHSKPAGPLQKLVATLIGLTFLALLFMFSVVMIPLLLIAGLLGFAYFYWKTRALRKAMAQVAEENNVIEGEAVVVRDDPNIRHLT